MAKETLEETFLLEMFNSCLINKTICDIVLQNVKLNWLPTQEHKDLLKEIRNQVRTNKKLPTYGSLRLFFRKDEDQLNLLSDIQDVEEKPDEESVLSSLQDFIKESMFSELLVGCADTYNRGDKKSAYDSFQKGADEFSKFSLSSSYAEQIFGDFDRRQIGRIIENSNGSNTKVPTGIDELDYKTNGGPELGELMMWMAQSKGGKSICLTHLGVHSARMGFPTAHFQLEGSRKQCTNRYDSLWTGTTYYDVKNGDIFKNNDKEEKVRNIIAKLGKSDIYIVAPEKFNSLTMIDIRKKVIELKKKIDLKVVIIDYMDLVEPGDQKYGPNEERQKLKRVNRMMKDLAIEQNVLIHTATQASDVNSELINDPNFVLTRSNLSEYKGKVEAVDGLITINRTYEERKNKICRLYMEAFREHEGGAIIHIKQNLKLTKFYDRKNTLLEFFEMQN